MSKRKSKIRSLANDKVIVISGQNVPIPLFCRVCKFPMKTKDDVLAYQKAKCCEACSYEFKGKIPNKNSNAWKHYINRRKLQASIILKLR